MRERERDIQTPVDYSAGLHGRSLLCASFLDTPLSLLREITSRVHQERVPLLHDLQGFWEGEGEERESKMYTPTDTPITYS